LHPAWPIPHVSLTSSAKVSAYPPSRFVKGVMWILPCAICPLSAPCALYLTLCDLILAHGPFPCAMCLLLFVMHPVSSPAFHPMCPMSYPHACPCFRSCSMLFHGCRALSLSVPFLISWAISPVLMLWRRAGISYLLLYRTERYQRLKDLVERSLKKCAWLQPPLRWQSISAYTHALTDARINRCTH